MKHPIKRKLNSIYTAVLGLTVILLFFLGKALSTQDAKKTGAKRTGGCTVTFIDVGQGDSALISCGGHNVLIDAGENDKGETVLFTLENLGVSKLDYVIGTHAHSDHIGGLDTVIRSVKTENVILCDLPDSLIPDTVTYTDLLTAVDETGTNLIAAKPGLTFNISGGRLTMLGPLREYSNQNDMSVVSRFDFENTSFLFMGDAESEPEADILKSGENINADVIKLGHHGSKTSSNKDFISAVSPKYAIISAGAMNSYGHPSAQTLTLMQSLKISTFRTDMSGTITAVSNGESISFSTEKE